MSCYTLQLVGRSPTHTDRPVDDVDGWHVAVQSHHHTNELFRTRFWIPYPFDISIEDHIRWHLESFPSFTPWEYRKSSEVQKHIAEYALGIFRQIGVLHQIGTSTNTDTIIIDVSESKFSSTRSNIFRLYWEVLENPKVWDELWAIAFPPKLLRKPKPVPRVMVRRSVPPSDDRFGQSYQPDGRRTIVQMRTVASNVMSIDSSTDQQLSVVLSFFRILLVVARRVDTEGGGSTEANETDLDPSLISEPLLEAIVQLSKDFDVRLEICRPGSWSALQSLLKDKGEGYYDLIHFDLHGKVDATKGAGLYFLSEAQSNSEDFGDVVFVPAYEVGKLMREAGVVMVALNACESAREGPIDAKIPSMNERLQNIANSQHTSTGQVTSASRIHTNLARTFVECGVPNVLAMSYQVTTSFVSIFYKSFYSALLRSESDVCEAVSIARRSLMSQKNRAVGFGVDVELEDWIIPVLYQSHSVTFTIVSAGEADSVRPSLAGRQQVEVVPARKKLFRRVFNSDSLNLEGLSLRRTVPAVPQSRDRMHGRGLEILYVEALLLSGNSRRTLFLRGKSGIGKTHFVKGLGNLWVLTGCISRKPVYIDCSTHPNWKVIDILRTIVHKVAELDLSAESIKKALTILRNSQELIIVDNVELENLSGEAGTVDSEHSLQSFIQGLNGGKSILIIVSREDLEHQSPQVLKKKTKKSAIFWELAERDEVAIQEVNLDILRNLGQTLKLDSKYKTREMRRFSDYLDHNPQLIALFLKAISRADRLENMSAAIHNLLLDTVQLPLDEPESRMVRVAHNTFTELGRMNNGHELQKLLLCLAPFNNFIPCGLHDRFFFPSAKCFLGNLRYCRLLEWPSSADASIVQQDEDMSKVPSEMFLQLSHLAEESVDLFCVLIQQLIRSGLVQFTAQSQDMRTAIEDYHQVPSDAASTRKLLMSLSYLRINPILTHHLRSQFGKETGGLSHGLSQKSVVMAYCVYFKSFSISNWNDYASQQPNMSPPIDTTATAEEEAFTSDSVFFHDACNIYTAVHMALMLPHPSMRWPMLPFSALNDLTSLAMRTFNSNARYKPLPTGTFGEESILILLRAVLIYYESAPRAERESPTPLRIATTLSLSECLLMWFIGASEYSDISVYRKQLISRIKGAMSIMQKIRRMYGVPGQPPSSSERYLGYLLEDISSEHANNKAFKRRIGDEGFADYVGRVTENMLLATAVRGGLLGPSMADG